MASRYTTLEMLERLIAFDTVSSKSNLGIIDFIEDYLRSWGIASHRTPSTEGNKANLWATVDPQDMTDGIVLSGHTDVVPVTDQSWHSDPFILTKKDNKVFGRGTADMKTFIAAVLAGVPDMMKKPLRVPLHFAFSYDEEVGCLGVPRLIQDVVRRLPRPRLVIVGEPTEMTLVVAHKGVHQFRTTFIGRSAHSSSPQLGANAIVAAAEAILILQDMAAQLRQSTPKDSPFDPPFSTIGVGIIEGGTAGNVVPARCTLHWDVRNLPDLDVDALVTQFEQRSAIEILSKLHQVAPEATVYTERVASIPPLSPESDSPAAELIQLLTGRNDTHVVAYGTEGGLFQAAGFSCVVCGPGNIAQAHQANEFITLAQVDAGTKFIKDLTDWAQS
ncbi:MAG: acetylornithine deacetylase [Alphaproteobacteria bacterium]